MREKFLPRRLAFLIIVRGRGQREILKNPRPAGSWQPFKSIFGERKKDRPQRAGSPALSVLCAKEPDRGSLRQLQSKFLPRCQNPQFCGFAPRGKLVGECLPQTLLCGLRRLSPPRSCGKKGGHDHAKEIQHTPPQPRCENPAVRR